MATVGQPVELSIRESAEALWSGTPLPVGSSIQLPESLRRSIEGAMGSAMTFARGVEPELYDFATKHLRNDAIIVSMACDAPVDGLCGVNVLLEDDVRAANDYVTVTANRPVNGRTFAGGSAVSNRTFEVLQPFDGNPSLVRLRQTYRVGMHETPLDVAIVAVDETTPLLGGVVEITPRTIHPGMAARLGLAGQIAGRFTDLPKPSAKSLDFGESIAHVVFGPTRTKGVDGPVAQTWSARSLYGTARQFDHKFVSTAIHRGNIGGIGGAARYSRARITNVHTLDRSSGVAQTATVELQPTDRSASRFATTRYVLEFVDGRAVVKESGRDGVPISL